MGYSIKMQGKTLKGWQIFNTEVRTAFQRACCLSQLKVSYKFIIAEHEPSLLTREEVLLWPCAVLKSLITDIPPWAEATSWSKVLPADSAFLPCSFSLCSHPLTLLDYRGSLSSLFPLVLVPLCIMVSHGPTSMPCLGHGSKIQDTKRV